MAVILSLSRPYTASVLVFLSTLCLLLTCLLVDEADCIRRPKRKSVEVKIAAVLPKSDERLFSISRMRPAADIAIETVERLHILPQGYHLSISYRDSKCSESVGMNEAINFYIKNEVNVYFGPICDFSAAPVARQTHFWDIPMVSVGAMARDFRTRRTEVYPLLTRAGLHFSSVADSTVAIFHNEYNWTKFKILYYKDGQDDIVVQMCSLAADAFVNGISHEDYQFDHYRVMDNSDIETILKDEVGNTYSGKPLITFPSHQSSQTITYFPPGYYIYCAVRKSRAASGHVMT